MIVDLRGTTGRRTWVDGLPIRTQTGDLFKSRELDSLTITDRQGWIALARSLRGQFVIIAVEAGSAVAITDMTGSLPVFVLFAPDGKPWKLATSMAELEGDSTRAIRRTALFQYIAIGAMDMNGETIYTDIGRAAAGSVSAYSAAGETSHEYVCWQKLTEPGESDPDAASQRLEALIQTYTGCAMSSLTPGDPLGILLSGGTDSTLLAAILRDTFSGDRLKCFTQHFRLRRYSELAQARENAADLGIRTEPVTLGRAKHFEAVLALNSRQQDQPCVTMQAFNLWSLIGSASGTCRAFMLGEHADSLFLGFGHFFQGLPPEQAAYLSVTEGLSWEKKLKWLLPPVGVSEPDRELLSALALPEGEFREWLEDFAEGRRKRLAPYRDLHLTTLQQLNGQIDGGLSWQRIMLPVLRSVQGIRLLTPFFDSAIVGLALGLSASLKYRDGETKFLLRYLLRKHTGRTLNKRPAAASPVAVWRMLVSGHEREGVSPVLRKYYNRLSRRNSLSLGGMVNHHLKVASLGLWMGARNL